MNKYKLLTAIFIGASLIGCAAKQMVVEAQAVEIVNELPDSNKCKFVGEIVGSQGNWFTGNYTSNKDLVIGARNELRNEGYKLGANVVYIQDMSNASAYNSLGTTNTTAVGKAYDCAG